MTQHVASRSRLVVTAVALVTLASSCSIAPDQLDDADAAAATVSGKGALPAQGEPAGRSPDTAPATASASPTDRGPADASDAAGAGENAERTSQPVVLGRRAEAVLEGDEVTVPEVLQSAAQEVGEGVVQSADPQDANRAEETVSKVLTEAVSVPDQSPEETTVIEVPESVGGAYASQLISSQLELVSMGWTREGEIHVTDVTVHELESGLLALEACVDSTGVTLRDSEGEVVSQPSPRSRQIFILEPSDAGDTVVAHTFPEDPSC